MGATEYVGYLNRKRFSTTSIQYLKCLLGLLAFECYMVHDKDEHTDTIPETFTVFVLQIAPKSFPRRLHFRFIINNKCVEQKPSVFGAKREKNHVPQWVLLLISVHSIILPFSGRNNSH